ncbi:outer membrane beta-barrel protein [uncultured Parabacteroides sp.]|uniref:outer membrane beta-barrel protein n=1 Tax=uncultured Parabacteroides sp. TaxID=512312 RepID=UPI0025EF86CB|nr:outer membrane beta-barrel protein [uncultured Parabacteroides sp.]
MKKTVYFIVLFFCNLSGITAQSQWSFGPKIGLGISDVSVTGIDHNSRTGVTAGLFGEYRIQNFALEADFLYANQGFKWNTDAIEENYLLIPLKVKLYMPYILKGLNIFAGPQLDLCIKRNDWIWLWMSEGDATRMGKQNVPYQNTLASITFGLGYRFDFGLDLAFSYNAGIVSNVKEYSDKNRVFQITAGYDLCKLFKLCGKK